MKFFIVTYSFKKQDLIMKASLEKVFVLFPKSHKCFDNVWLVGSDEEPNDIYTKLKFFFTTDNGQFFIIEVTKNYYGWMPAGTWEWIADNLK